MQIKANTLRIEYADNPGQIVQIVVNGWIFREGINDIWQVVSDPGQVFLRVKQVRHSAETVQVLLENLNELLSCIRQRTQAKLLGYIDFGDAHEIWRVSASEWVHGKYVIEWDRAVAWDDVDEHAKFGDED